MGARILAVVKRSSQGFHGQTLVDFSVSPSPMASVLLRCGDGDGDGGDGGARVQTGFPGFGSPAAAQGGGAAGVTEAEEVGRFWKYCSPGSSSSRPPHGYAWRDAGVSGSCLCDITMVCA